MRAGEKFIRVFVLSFLCVLSVACGGKEDRLARHFEKGTAYFAQADYEKARVEYKNVLQIDPKNVQASFGMGQVLEQQQNWRGAAGQYQRVLELEAGHSEAKIRLARLYLLGDVPAKAMELADEVLKSAPQNADALSVKAGALARSGDNVAAVEQARAALKIQPDHEDALMLLAGYYTHEKKFDEAITLLRDGMVHKPKSLTLRSVLAQTYALRGDNDKTAEILREIIALEPDTLAHHVRLTQFYLKLKRVDEAEAVMRAVAARAPTDTDAKAAIDAKLALTEFLFSARDMNTAQKQLQEYIASYPKEYALRFALASLYESARKAPQTDPSEIKPAALNDEVKRVYREIIAMDGIGRDGLKARTRLAGTLFLDNQDNQNEEGERLLAEVLKETPKDNEALQLRATRALYKKDAATAIADARTILKEQPQSLSGQLLLADAHMLNKEVELAREALQKAVDLNPRDIKTRFALAKMQAEAGEVDRSIDNLKALVSFEPQNPGVREALFKAYLAKNDLDSAAAVAAQTKREFPKAALGAYLAGLLAQQQGKLAKSAEEFETALRLDPAQPEVMIALVKSHIAQKQPEKALARLRDAARKFPDSTVIRNLIGEVLIVQRNVKEAEVEFRKAIALNPKFPTPYRNLAALRSSAGDGAGAAKWYEQGVSATAGDPGLTFEWATLLEVSGDYDRAIAQYEAMLAKNPASVSAANNLAMMLVTYKQDPQSWEKAKTLVEPLRNSKNPAYLDTVGWVYYKHSDTDAAQRALDEAVRAAPEEPLLRYHLGMTLYKKGDLAAAREHLKKAVEAQREFHGIEEARSTLTKIAGA